MELENWTRELSRNIARAGHIRFRADQKEFLFVLAERFPDILGIHFISLKLHNFSKEDYSEIAVEAVERYPYNLPNIDTCKILPHAYEKACESAMDFDAILFKSIDPRALSDKAYWKFLKKAMKDKYFSPLWISHNAYQYFEKICAYFDQNSHAELPFELKDNLTRREWQFLRERHAVI